MKKLFLSEDALCGILFGVLVGMIGIFIFKGYQNDFGRKDYIVTCTSLVPNSKPIIYHVDSYSMGRRSDPRWTLTLLNNEVIYIYPYTNDLKFEEVPEGSLTKKE